jgi:hypothetical protein
MIANGIVGEVVRVAPNEVSFVSIEASKEIYGHAAGGRRPLLKTEFYTVNDSVASIASES